jgi:hypothetical protein
LIRQRSPRGLARIGEDAIAKANNTALDDYFARDFVFHGPDGDATLDDLKQLWAGMRHAFTEFTVTRDQILVQGTSPRRERECPASSNTRAHTPPSVRSSRQASR